MVKNLTRSQLRKEVEKAISNVKKMYESGKETKTMFNLRMKNLNSIKEIIQTKEKK